MANRSLYQFHSLLVAVSATSGQNHQQINSDIYNSLSDLPLEASVALRTERMLGAVVGEMVYSMMHIWYPQYHNLWVLAMAFILLT